ncbi:MAG: hypothetical protein BJ554DRAFT_1815 [Olpidium bornovanus]|uniref:PH domain-containing protein n=1 Tax=Olpidium bornovanus TaxID=278681 RepID=A0A8H8A138_9FUNG|nr:MAG: hypothetical protein BJ554DRAFT_1815 [Olpidium bornovanus]
MDLATLKELGIASFGKRFNIARAVSELKEEWASVSPAAVPGPGEPRAPVGPWPAAGREHVGSAESPGGPAINEKFVAVENARPISSACSPPPPSRSRGGPGISRARSVMSRLLPSMTRDRSEFESTAPVLTPGANVRQRRDFESRPSFVAERKIFAQDRPDAPLESTKFVVPVEPAEEAARSDSDDLPFAEVSCDQIDGSKFFEDAEHAGWLHRRRGGKIKSWQNVWCSSKNGVLFYQKYKGHRKVLWSVQLKGYKVVPDPNICRGRYCWKAKHESRRTLYFYTDNADDMRAWVRLMMKASIQLDVGAPVVSSYADKTVPIHVAQEMRPRPPSLCETACWTADALRKRCFLLQRPGTSASASSPATPLSDSAFSSSRAASGSRCSSPATSASSDEVREINPTEGQSSHGFVRWADSPETRIAFAGVHPEFRKGAAFGACHENPEEYEEAGLHVEVRASFTRRVGLSLSLSVSLSFALWVEFRSTAFAVGRKGVDEFRARRARRADRKRPGRPAIWREPPRARRGGFGLPERDAAVARELHVPDGRQ